MDARSAGHEASNGCTNLQFVGSAILTHLAKVAMLPARSDHQCVGDADLLGGDHDGKMVLLIRDSQRAKKSAILGQARSIHPFQSDRGAPWSDEAEIEMA